MRVKKTRRTNVVAFRNGFHGCTLGASSLTANDHYRQSSRELLVGVDRMSYDGYSGSTAYSVDSIEALFDNPSVQGEGGLNTASAEWAQKIQAIARKYQALVIVDEIQTGCGRTGSFFAFEQLGIEPDMVTMAKSLSGYGLPMAMLLLKPELDVWATGEHNGTFRGNNHAFVTAAVALEKFWSDDAFQRSVQNKSEQVKVALSTLSERFGLQVKGRGMMTGLSFDEPELCAKSIAQCYEQGIVVESSGPNDEVLKVMPPLTIDQHELAKGLEIISRSVEVAMTEALSAAEKKACAQAK